MAQLTLLTSVGFMELTRWLSEQWLNSKPQEAKRGETWRNVENMAFFVAKQGTRGILKGEFFLSNFWWCIMKNKEFIVVVLTVIGLYTYTDPITTYCNWAILSWKADTVSVDCLFSNRSFLKHGSIRLCLALTFIHRYAKTKLTSNS